MALVVMARKEYGEAAEVDYPNLAGKPKSSGGLRRVRLALDLRPHDLLRINGTIRVPGERSSFSQRTDCMTLIATRRNRGVIFCVLALALLGSAVAQHTDQLPPEMAPKVLSSEELKKLVPGEYFFRGQKAPVQLRNAAGFQRADGKMTVAALVDSSGYSTAVQQKYQGLLITETKLNIGGSTLPPGQYGFGFTADGRFVVMDVGNNDLLNVPSQTQAALPRAVPLKLVEDGSGYRLYGGKKWVSIRAE
jgi:hypothetical protein